MNKKKKEEDSEDDLNKNEKILESPKRKNKKLLPIWY